MAGDEIVADWLGDVYSNAIGATDTPQRFSATSLRFRTVIIHPSTSSSCDAYIGKYYASAATFELRAVRVIGLGTIKFEFVDLYNLGFTRYSASTNISVLGINQY